MALYKNAHDWHVEFNFAARDFTQVLSDYVPPWIPNAKQFEVDAATHGRPLLMVYLFIWAEPTTIECVRRLYGRRPANKNNNNVHVDVADFFEYISNHAHELVDVLERHRFITRVDDSSDD